MAVGYVYILANSSMPGLVKVGKTTRRPSERADELSGVTGVATPFIVVYEEYFEDCDAVEAHVHTALAVKGLRLSDNREFFRAAVSDVVRTITSLKAAEIRETTNELSGLLTPDSSDVEDFQLDEHQTRTHRPWDDLMGEADKHYYGWDGYIQDYAEAFKLYRDAARLGSPKAYERLGRMYHYGNGLRQDRPIALDCYKEGAKKGNHFCYASMAQLFVDIGHMENARKALSRFISGGEADSWSTCAYEDHIVRMKWILAPPIHELSTDNELLSIARAYFPQLRLVLQADLGPGGAATKHPAIKAPLTALLKRIESEMR